MTTFNHSYSVNIIIASIVIIDNALLCYAEKG